jgi:hypothetical protein
MTLAGPQVSEPDERVLRDTLARSANQAEAFASAVRELRIVLPLPGSGATARRLAGLRALGRVDLVLARLVEGHVDAVAILAELGGAVVRPDELWGVWAAVPNSLAARKQDGHWLVNGTKPWCSGAGTCTRALVTKAGPDGPRLFAVDVADTQPVPNTWPATGMAGSDSRTVQFDAVHATPVGGPGAYTSRPGFWHGGVGVAACWLGGAYLVARPLLAKATSDDPHVLAHLGAVDAALASGDAMLATAAAQIDAAPSRNAQRLALQVRAVAESVATAVADHVGRALGAGPLCQDAAHGRNIADLLVYVRQSHAERDLAQLGGLVAGARDRAW